VNGRMIKKVKQCKAGESFFRDTGGVVDSNVPHLVDSTDFGKESGFGFILKVCS